MFIFSLCTIACHLVLGFSSLFGSHHSFVISFGLIFLLGRHNLTLIKFQDPVVCFFRYLGSGFCFLPGLVSHYDLFGAGTSFSLFVQSLGSSLRRFGLTIFGQHLRTIQDSHRIPPAHLFSFIKTEYFDPPRHFSGNTYFRCLSLSLNILRFRLPKQKTENCHQKHQNNDSGKSHHEDDR